MLEILILVKLAGALSRLATGRGRSPTWAGLGVGLWLAGEAMGFLLGTLFELELVSLYSVSIIIAAAGAALAYLVIDWLPPLSVSPAARVAGRSALRW